MNVVEESAVDLDSQLLMTTLNALRHGDYSVRVPAGLSGANGAMAEILNEIMETSALRERERAAEEMLDSRQLVTA